MQNLELLFEPMFEYTQTTSITCVFKHDTVMISETCPSTMHGSSSWLGCIVGSVNEMVNSPLVDVAQLPHVVDIFMPSLRPEEPPVGICSWAQWQV